MESSTLELQDRFQSHISHPPGFQEESGSTPPVEGAEGRHEFSLPQTDGGKDAWLFLAACFVVEALVWGKHHSVTDFAICCDSKSKKQDFLSHLVSSKTTIALMSHFH